MTTEPSKVEVIELVRQHYGLSLPQAVRLMNTPLHPHELRDDFAGRAMTTLITQMSNPHPKDVAEWAYDYADAMLAARIKEK